MIARSIVVAVGVVLVTALLSTSPSAGGSDPTVCITVKALDCYLKLPAEVLLVTDAPDQGTLLSLNGKGQFRFLPRSAERHASLSERTRAMRGHLEVIEYDQPGEREPLLVTVIRSKDQQLELTGDARQYTDLIVNTCLAHVRPAMRIFRSLSECSSEPPSEAPR